MTHVTAWLRRSKLLLGTSVPSAYTAKLNRAQRYGRVARPARSSRSIWRHRVKRWGARFGERRGESREREERQHMESTSGMKSGGAVEGLR